MAPTIARMDPEKVASLFGQPPDGVDPGNPDDRVELLSREVAEDHPRHGAQVALRLAVADQIAHDEPPQVWRTAQRLLAEGRDRATVMRQLVLALTPSLMNTVVGGAEFDLDAYLAALKRLPIPSGDEWSGRYSTPSETGGRSRPTNSTSSWRNDSASRPATR
jgi:hypothetical protein